MILNNLDDYAVAYFENLLKKYGKGQGTKNGDQTF